MNLKNAWNSFRELIVHNNAQTKALNTDVAPIDSAAQITTQVEKNNELENLKNQVKALEAKNSKLTALQTTTKHKEDPLVDADWNKTMNRRAYMDDMWAIRERS